jgi:hypothetical protein
MACCSRSNCAHERGKRWVARGRSWSPESKAPHGLKGPPDVAVESGRRGSRRASTVSAVRRGGGRLYGRREGKRGRWRAGAATEDEAARRSVRGGVCAAVLEVELALIA